MIALVGKAVGLGLAAVLATQAPAALAPPAQHERAVTPTSPGATPASPSPSRPLAGIVIALDPGHQLGSGRFPREIARIVPAGRGYRKQCMTAGTAIPGGLPEPTLTWRVVQVARARLEALGATVRLTRTSNSIDRWGPCVDTRGRFPGRVGARLMVSVHVDGSLDRSAHGYHVIVPSRGHLEHPAILRPSRRLALAMRRGFDQRHLARSTYIGGGTALSPRNDLGTLNLSSVPAVMIELGNSHHPGDARRLSSPAGRRTYAAAVVAGIRAFLGR